MTARRWGSRRIAVAAAALVFGSAWSLSSDPPDSRINAVSGAIETADAMPGTVSYDIRHTINLGSGRPMLVFVVAATPDDERSPRIVVAPNGDSWVAWWRDGATDQVRIRRRVQATGLWSEDRAVTGSGEDGRNPELAYDGQHLWLVYESSVGASRGIIAGTILDEPEPFGNGMTLGTTSYAGDLDTQIRAESSRVWVTWIDGAAAVGWSQYDPATGLWSAPAYEPYGTDGVAAARDRVKARVVGS